MSRHVAKMIKWQTNKYSGLKLKFDNAKDCNCKTENMDQNEILPNFKRRISILFN